MQLDFNMVLLFLCFSLLVFICLRRACYNILDPFMVLGVAIPFSAAMLYSLVDSGRITPFETFSFLVVFSGYYIAVLVASRLLSWGFFRCSVVRVLDRFSLKEVKVFVGFAILVTSILGVAALVNGGYGDNRQVFSKLMRPLVIIQNGFFLMALILLLKQKLEKSFVVFSLLTLLAFSIPFSGKSVLIPFAFWLGVLMFVRRVTVRPVHILCVMGVTFFGVYVMGAIAYNVSSISDFFALLAYRFMMFGDVYIYAYAEGALSVLREDYNVTFVRYVLHPLTAMIGWRAYDKPIGSMLASEVSGQDLLTGPNPQLPVLLDFFFHGAFIAQFLLAVLAGCFVVMLRVIASRISLIRMRYIEIAIIAAAIFAPQAGFLDFSLVLITCISVGLVAVFFTAVDLILSVWGWRRTSFAVVDDFPLKL